MDKKLYNLLQKAEDELMEIENLSKYLHLEVGKQNQEYFQFMPNEKQQDKELIQLYYQENCTRSLLELELANNLMKYVQKHVKTMDEIFERSKVVSEETTIYYQSGGEKL